MIGKHKKTPPVQRNPHIVRQHQSTFHYSSNRAAPEQTPRNRRSFNPETVQSQRFSLRRVKLTLTYGVVLGGVVVLSIYLSLLSVSPRFTIINNQPPLRSIDTYNQAAAQIAGNGLLSHSKFTINRQKLAQELQNQFPELSDVRVTTPLFGRSASVKAVSSSPAAVLATNSGNYILDKRGVALFDNRRASPSIDTDSLITINDQSGLAITVGKPALTAAQIDFASEVKRQAAAKQMLVESMTLSAGGGELHVKHQGLQYFVRYSLYENPRTSFGTFYATKESLDRVHATPAEYVDVRVPERAYVK